MDIACIVGDLDIYKVSANNNHGCTAAKNSAHRGCSRW